MCLTLARKGRVVPMARSASSREACALPADKVVEIERLVEVLRRRVEEESLVDAATRLSEGACREVWDNSEDAAYDAL